VTSSLAIESALNEDTCSSGVLTSIVPAGSMGAGGVLGSGITPSFKVVTTSVVPASKCETPSMASVVLTVWVIRTCGGKVGRAESSHPAAGFAVSMKDPPIASRECLSFMTMPRTAMALVE
jgi:hypothetical protein